MTPTSTLLFLRPLMAMATWTWLRLALLVAAVPAVGLGLLFISSLFVTQNGMPTVTVCACGPNELRFVETEHTTFFNTYHSEEFYWNSRLIDLSGKGFGPGRWAFLPLGLNRLFPAGQPLPEGSGLHFYPAALAPDALAQQQVQARDSVAHECLVWVNPGQFTRAEFAQIGDCLRDHAAVLNAALTHGHSVFTYQLTRLVYADFRLHNQPLTFSSPGRNPTGGYDSLEIAAAGPIWLRRGTAAASVTGGQWGARVPGTTTLVFRQTPAGAEAEADNLPEDVVLVGPRPTLAEIGRYRDARGHLLSATFQLRFLSAADERRAAAGRHPLF